MNYSVRKLSESFVKPSEPTPSAKLPLSWQDKLPANMVNMDTLFVYERGQQPAKVIREALSKALVDYYPIAGVFSSTEEGELEIDCSVNHGVWFVEAVADCSLEDIDFLDYPIKIPKEQLFPQPPHGDDPMHRITMFQVTQFSCGGFAIGFRQIHAIVDGRGCMQFLKAVAEIARGQQRPSVTPVWCRETLPQPPGLTGGSLPPLPPASKHEFSVIDIPLHKVEQLKSKLTEELGRRCSTFDALTSIAWQCRSRAIKLAPDAEVHLVFPTDARRFLKEDGATDYERYYGNCVYLVTITCPGEKITNGSLADVAKVIKAAKDNLPNEFSKWIKGEISFGDPYKFASSYGTLFVNDWSAVSTEEQDYGWGAPACVLPQVEGRNSCLLLKSPAAKKSARLLTQCVQQEHLQSFVQQLMEYCNE